MMRRRTAETSLLNSQDKEEQEQRGLVLQRIMERRRKVHSVRDGIPRSHAVPDSCDSHGSPFTWLRILAFFNGIV